MVDVEKLTLRAQRAYEVGRLRMATLIILVLAPVVCACIFLSGAREECACLGVVLMIVAVLLRWRSARGVSLVTTGLLAGAVPLALGLLISGYACPPEFALACSIACGCAGGVAGAVIGVRAARRKMDRRDWLPAAAVAVLAASVGCVGVESGVIGVVIGVVVALAVAASAQRLAHR